MRAIKLALAALGLFCCPRRRRRLPPSCSATAWALGVSRAGHLKNLSKISIHIRGRKMLEQIAQTPPGSTVFLVLGTNDAEGSIARLDKSIDDIVAGDREEEHHADLARAALRAQGVGHPRARARRHAARAGSQNTAVRYVSMRDDVMCSGAFHERDGVHLKMKGYAHMWEKARDGFGLCGRRAETSEPEVTRTGSTSARTAIKTASVGASLRPRLPHRSRPRLQHGGQDCVRRHVEEGPAHPASGAAEAVSVMIRTVTIRSGILQQCSSRIQVTVAWP